MKISLQGLQTLNTEYTEWHENTDYGIFLIAGYNGKFISPDKEDEKYFLKIDRIDSIMDLKTGKSIDFKRGKFTKSQQWRFMTENKLGKSDYDNFMDYCFSHFDEWSDEYIETLKS